MKARTRIGLLLFTISAASLAGLAIRNGIAQQEVKADGEYTFKLDFSNAAWNGDGAKTMVYVFNATSKANEWVDVNVNITPASTVVDVTVPNNANNYDTFIVVRLDPSTVSSAADKWDAKWNQTQNITIDTNKNHITIDGLNGDDCPKRYRYLADFTTADRFYVDAFDVDYWDNDNAITYIHFIKDSTNTIKALNKVWNSVGYKLYYVDIDADFQAFKYKVVRGKDYDGIDGSYNQTAEYEFYGTNASNRAIKLDSDLSITFTEKDDAFLADAWGTHFRSLELCDENGMRINAGSKMSTYSKPFYNALVDNHLANKRYFESIPNTGSAPRNLAVLRYDTIWVKNYEALHVNYYEFLNRNPSFASLPQGALVTIEKQDVAFPVGIACVSLLGIAGLGGLLLLKKKKEQ